jgi:demethylmenaquinone methyltransferase/2-methoxy-6-polyprenyl-1,4-benzoquinol methylase
MNEIQEFQHSSRVTRSNYDRLSPWYDLLAGRSERRAKEAGLEILAVKEGDTVLEIGSGTGQALLALARSVGSSGSVVGIDLSRGMISQAAAKISRTALSQRAALVCGDALYLPFQASFCDAVFMSFTLELFPPDDSLIVLSECQRVLRNGGSLCVVAMAERANPGLPIRMYTWAQQKFPAVIDCRPIDVQGVMSQAGFQIRDAVDMEMWGLSIGIVLAASHNKNS